MQPTRMNQLAINIVDFDAARTDELVRLWRESFEFGVGVVDPHPIEDQREHFVRARLRKARIKTIARGVEPNWQLDDVKYEWIAEDAVS